MTDSQWLRILSFLPTCSGICVGKEASCRQFVATLHWMAHSIAPWRRLPAEYGK